jgi:hypothetical protein
MFTGEQHGDTSGVQRVDVFHAVAKSHITKNIRLKIGSCTTNLKMGQQNKKK